MRLEGKIAVIIGAGQSPGEGIGNGRATALRFAQEGAKMVRKAGGDSLAFEADVTREATLAATIAAAQKRWGRVDILHYNVGVSIAGGDASPTEITEEAFDRICALNL